MDCQDVRVLWALGRRGDAIDPTERAAIQQHLDVCPDCAAHTHSDQAVDAALAAAMRAVPVPAGLRSRVLTRVAATRPRTWPRVAAAAAAVLLIAIAGVSYSLRPTRTTVDPWEVYGMWTNNGRSPEEVQEWFKARGIRMAAYPGFKQELLWNYAVEEFQGRRVAKLLFFNGKDQKIAEILVLDPHQFDTRELPDGAFTNNPVIIVKHQPEFVYLIGTNDDERLESFRDPNAF
jgi:anti-sigma factor (TIGR02949 family)